MSSKRPVFATPLTYYEIKKVLQIKIELYEWKNRCQWTWNGLSSKNLMFLHHPLSKDQKRGHVETDCIQSDTCSIVVVQKKRDRQSGLIKLAVQKSSSTSVWVPLLLQKEIKGRGFVFRWALVHEPSWPFCRASLCRLLFGPLLREIPIPPFLAFLLLGHSCYGSATRPEEHSSDNTSFF